MVSHWNSSGIFSQDSPHCSSAAKSKGSCQKWAKNQKNFQDGSSSCRCSTTSQGDLKTTRKKIPGKIDDPNNVGFVSSNVNSSHKEASLYVFEDNEAVIKMIRKRRSPTMRHVSRTHRVALDWLFDRVNLDPKIQIKYIDTKKPNSQTC